MQITSVFVYNMALALHSFGMKVAAVSGHAKAKKIIEGRKISLQKTNTFFSKQEKKQTLWMHCASVGEYEQGLPVLQAYCQKYPETFVMLTFYSSSGVEAIQVNEYVHQIEYLPLDNASNANKWVQWLQPNVVFFVKYELWYHYLQAVCKQKIPLYMISMYVPTNHIFQKWYGGLSVKTLQFFTTIFVQDAESKKRLNQLSINKVKVAADTRYARVAMLAKTKWHNTEIEKFANQAATLIAGSTWPADEQLLANWWLHTKGNRIQKLIIVPHEVTETHIASLQQLFADAQLITESTILPTTKVLIVNKMGILSKLYQYGTIAFVGGGFGKGIHNILEPLAFGIPVIHGPNCKRFLEAQHFAAIGAAAKVANWQQIQQTVASFLENKEKISKEILLKIDSNSHAAQQIINNL